MDASRINEIVTEAARATPEERQRLADAIANLPTAEERVRRILAALDTIAAADAIVREELAALGYEATSYGIGIVPHAVFDALGITSSATAWSNGRAVDVKSGTLPSGLRIHAQTDDRPATEAEMERAGYRRAPVVAVAAVVPVEPPASAEEPKAEPRGAGWLEVN